MADRHGLFAEKPQQSALRAFADFAQIDVRAWKAALLVAAAAARRRDRPAEARLEHGRVLVHVLPVEMQAGLEAQRVARAEADGLRLARGEQRPREPLRIFRRHRDLVAILAGVAGARD